MLKKVIKIFLGRKGLQPFFEWLHKAALKGMNIGLGSDFSTSGEEWVLGYIKSKMEKKSEIIIFDVGANIGEYTKQIKNIFDNLTFKIYSFEPSKTTYDKLKQNIGEQQNIYIYNLGFNDKDTTTTLYSNKSSSGIASIYQRNLQHLDTKLDQMDTIELTTVDNFSAKYLISHINFLKIDVEGNELKVLQGAKDMINAGNIDFIQFEFGGTAIDAHIYFQDFFYLLKDKYNIYRILRNGLRPIYQYSELQENFITTNFFAERK
jgi:FkbM family methyltransferase